jgi:DNA-binding transcriptional regulator GbsR (MarR family)
MSVQFEETRQEFIQFWGEMASSWGISKTMAQVFALLFSSSQPLDTDTIMDTLDISRGNANMNLHKLMNWGLVLRVEMPDTRKDYFVAEKDVVLMTRNIIRHRQERELAPVQDSLRKFADQLLHDAHGHERTLAPAEQEFRQNLLAMAEFMTVFMDLTAMLLPFLDPEHNSQVLRNLASSLPHSDASSPE